jgi:hypothetical protein
MKWRRWIEEYGSLAVLLTMFFVVNPELRSFLWTVDVLGIDLMIIAFGLQLRMLLLAMPILAARARLMACTTSYGFLRIGSRLLLIFTPHSRAMYGVSLFLSVCSNSLWCPTAIASRR